MATIVNQMQHMIKLNARILVTFIYGATDNFYQKNVRFLIFHAMYYWYPLYCYVYNVLYTGETNSSLMLLMMKMAKWLEVSELYMAICSIMHQQAPTPSHTSQGINNGDWNRSMEKLRSSLML